MLANGQVQIRDLVMGEGTSYRILKEFNPFNVNVRTAHSAARAWNHGSWSGVEWAEERVVPIRISVVSPEQTPGAWLALHQQMMKALAPIGDFVQDIECRFTYGGTEYLLFGRPRMVESEVETTQIGWSYAQAAFVALDPRIYSGLLHVNGPTGLPLSDQGLVIPSVVDSSPPYGLVMPGTNGNYASTPDNAQLDITGDIGIIFDGTANDWTPATAQYLVAKFQSTGNQRSYRLFLNSATGFVALGWSANGTADLVRNATAPLPNTGAGRQAIAAFLDVNDGAGGHLVSFFTAPTAAGPWTPLGTAGSAAAGTTSIFSGTAPLEVGAVLTGTLTFAGTIHKAEVRAGADFAGALRASPDFTRQEDGDTSFVDLSSRTWTVNGSASINSPVRRGGLVLPTFITGKLIAGELDLVNAGTTETSLFVRIDGPATDPGFLLRRPDGTVQSVRMTLILNPGQWLDIDTAAGTVFLDGNQASGQRGRAFWDIDPQPLQPGTNILRFLAAEYNSQAMITTSHRDAWW